MNRKEAFDVVLPPSKAVLPQSSAREVLDSVLI